MYSLASMGSYCQDALLCSYYSVRINDHDYDPLRACIGIGPAASHRSIGMLLILLWSHGDLLQSDCNATLRPGLLRCWLVGFRLSVCLASGAVRLVNVISSHPHVLQNRGRDYMSSD